MTSPKARAPLRMEFLPNDMAYLSLKDTSALCLFQPTIPKKSIIQTRAALKSRLKKYSKN